MIRRKYVGESKMFEYDRHYRECQATGRPFVKARKSPVHKRYHVQIDMATCSRELSEDEQAAILEAFEAEADFVKPLPGKSEGFFIDPELAWFDGVSDRHLDSLCCWLHDMIHARDRIS